MHARYAPIVHPVTMSRPDQERAVGIDEDRGQGDDRGAGGNARRRIPPLRRSLKRINSNCLISLHLYSSIQVDRQQQPPGA